MNNKSVKKAGIIIIGVIILLILVCAWAPWLTQEYSQQKVLKYFSNEYDIEEERISITYIEKKTDGMHIGISIPKKDNKSSDIYIHSWVTFYGEVKHNQPLELLN